MSAFFLAVAAAAAQPSMLAPNRISTTANEFGGSITPDGREIYYSVSVQHSYMYAIYFSRREADGSWGPQQLAPFSGRGRDFDPVISPDGQKLLFISDRPGTAGTKKLDYDIWWVDRQSDGSWSAAHRFGAPVNTISKSVDDDQGNEEFASIAANGTIYFAGDRRGGAPGMAIWRARLIDGHYEKPKLLSDVMNSGPFVGEPIIAPDESFLLFSAFGLPDGFGNWDIYITRRGSDGQWMKPENLGPAVNTAQRDYSPRLAPDGHTLIFTSERYFGGADQPLNWRSIKSGLASLENGQGNIYSVDLRGLGLASFKP
jgi:Tol biopolymer transport system component